jgi:hypothetical protein
MAMGHRVSVVCGVQQTIGQAFLEGKAMAFGNITAIDG